MIQARSGQSSAMKIMDKQSSANREQERSNSNLAANASQDGKSSAMGLSVQKVESTMDRQR